MMIFFLDMYLVTNLIKSTKLLHELCVIIESFVCFNKQQIIRLFDIEYDKGHGDPIIPQGKWYQLASEIYFQGLVLLPIDVRYISLQLFISDTSNWFFYKGINYLWEVHSLLVYNDAVKRWVNGYVDIRDAKKIRHYGDQLIVLRENHIAYVYECSINKFGGTPLYSISCLG
jgi:hypothetical protein